MTVNRMENPSRPVTDNEASKIIAAMAEMHDPDRLMYLAQRMGNILADVAENPDPGLPDEAATVQWVIRTGQSRQSQIIDSLPGIDT